MRFALKPRGLWVGAWFATMLLAFAAGQWMDSPAPAGTGETAAASVAEKDARDVERRRGGDAPAGGAGPLAGEAPGSPPRGSMGASGFLGRVAAGSFFPADWEAAAREAGLIDPSAARSWFDRIAGLPPGQRRDALLAELAGRIGESDPLGALSLAGRIGGVRARESARRQVLEAWAARDPNASLRWIEENEAALPGRLRMERYESWIEGFAQADPAAAYAYVAALPEDGAANLFRKREMMESVVEAQVAAGRIAEALASLEGLPAGPVRDEALEELYAEWAEEDPVAAARHYLGNRDEDGQRWAAGLVRSWAETDPEAAAGFVAGLGEEDPAYEIAVSSLIERWSRYDLQGPAEWLNGLPPSEQIDRAVAVYSVRASREDPEGAMTWAESIASEGTRERVMMRVAAGWREVDPEGFADYLESSEFDDETRTRLRESGPPGGFGGRWRD